MAAPGGLSAHPAALAIIRCGRYSLQVFTVGVFLSSLTVETWVLFDGDRVVLAVIQTLVCIAGVALQIVYAKWRERVREDAREDAPLLPVGEPVRVRTERWRRER